MIHFFHVPRCREEIDYPCADLEPKFITSKTESKWRSSWGHDWSGVLKALCQSPPNAELPGCVQKSLTGVQLQFWSACQHQRTGVRASLSLPHASVLLVQGSVFSPYLFLGLRYGAVHPGAVGHPGEQNSRILMSLKFLGVQGNKWCYLKDAPGQWWKQTQPMLFVSASLYIHTVHIWAPSLAQVPAAFLPLPAVHTLWGLAPGTACVTMPVQEGSRVFFPLGVLVSCLCLFLAFFLLLQWDSSAWQQWFTVHIVDRDRAWAMSLIPPSLDLSAPVTCTALWTWAHLCLRSSSAGLKVRALVPGRVGYCSANPLFFAGVGVSMITVSVSETLRTKHWQQRTDSNISPPCSEWSSLLNLRVTHIHDLFLSEVKDCL